jgi:mannose-6-phosphate isomerase
LVKLLFTSERLSVQVHPGDEYARQHENSRGKTEMWHILRAEGDARIATGLRVRLTAETLKQACLDGTIVDLLDWEPVQKGETYFIPAGTIHAIGGGVTVCEIQELSDVTYRLYDYGRPRELHLDKGLAVSKLEPANTRATPVPLAEGRQLLVDCSHFRTERLTVEGSATCAGGAKNSVYVALEGEGTIADLPFRAGDAFEASAGAQPFLVASPQAAFLITSEP